MELVPEKDWPQARTGLGAALKPEVEQILSIIAAGNRVKITEDEVKDLGYGSRELLAQRLRKVAQKRGFHINAVERVVLKGSNMVVPPEEVESFQDDEVEQVLFLRRRPNGS